MLLYLLNFIYIQNLVILFKFIIHEFLIFLFYQKFKLFIIHLFISLATNCPTTWATNCPTTSLIIIIIHKFIFHLKILIILFTICLIFF